MLGDYRKKPICWALVAFCCWNVFCQETSINQTERENKTPISPPIEEALLLEKIQKDDLSFFKSKNVPTHMRISFDPFLGEMDMTELAAYFGAPQLFDYFLKRRLESLTPKNKTYILNLLANRIPFKWKKRDGDPEHWKKEYKEWSKEAKRLQYKKTQILESLIAQKWPINVFDQYGLKPIQQAAIYCNLSAIKLLVKAGASIHEPSDAIDAPAPSEAFSGPATWNWYTGKGRQLFQYHIKARTPFELSIRGRNALATRSLGVMSMEISFTPEEQFETIDYLINSKASGTQSGWNGESVLSQCVNFLVNFDYQEPMQFPSGSFGSSELTLKVIKRLIANGVQAEQVIGSDYTVLSCAAAMGFQEAVTLFKEKTPSKLPTFDKKSYFNPYFHALFMAISEGHIDIARDLLHNGLDIFKPSPFTEGEKSGLSLVQLSSNVNPDFIEDLIKFEHDPSRLQLAKDWALSGALQKRKAASIEKWLKMGAKPNYKAGFEWQFVSNLLSDQNITSDSIFITILSLSDQSISQENLNNLLVRIVKLPSERSILLSKKLLEKFPSRHIKNKSEILSNVISSEKTYRELFSLLSIDDEDTKANLLIDTLEKEAMPTCDFLIKQKANPYYVASHHHQTALECAWNHHDKKVFKDFSDILIKNNMINLKKIHHFIDKFLLKCPSEECENYSDRFNALQLLGINFNRYRNHQLWSRGNKQAEEAEDSFFIHSLHNGEFLYELAKRGINFNRSFEGMPFLVGYFTYSIPLENTNEDLSRHTGLIQEVLKQGANPHQLACNATFLHQAALYGDVEVAKLFLATGIPINSTRAPHKATPLMVAAREGHTEVVRWLLKEKADIHKVSQDGWSALGVAKHFNSQGSHQETIRMLEEAGAPCIQPKRSK